MLCLHFVIHSCACIRRFCSCRSQRLPVRLCEHAACVAKDILYIAGGQQRYNMDGRYTTQDLYAFDLQLCVWSTVSIYGFHRNLEVYRL